MPISSTRVPMNNTAASTTRSTARPVRKRIRSTSCTARCRSWPDSMRLISDTDITVNRLNISWRKSAATPCDTISVQRPIRNASTARASASSNISPTARHTTPSS